MYHAGANGGQRVNSVSASGSAGCQSACVNNPLCTGVDFHTMTSTCYLHGPWSGYHVHFMSGVVHYDYKCRGRGLHILVFSTLYIGLYNSLYRPTIDRPTTVQALIVNVKCLVVCWNCCCKLSHQHLTFKQARAVWSCFNVCVRACVCVCDKVHEDMKVQIRWIHITLKTCIVADNVQTYCCLLGTTWWRTTWTGTSLKCTVNPSTEPSLSWSPTGRISCDCRHILRHSKVRYCAV